MNKKPMIIVGALFALLIIALIVYFILSITTDIFKPTSQIFQKYLKEDVENIEKIIDFSKEQNYLNILSQSNYRDNTKIGVKYTNSKGNVENFNITSGGITNNSDNNSFRTIDIKYGEDYNIMNVEFLRENQQFGLLFSNVVRQFISTEINDIEDFLNTMGINYNELEQYDIQRIWNIITNEREKIEKGCYSYISGVGNGKFSKQKSTSITLNNGEEKEATPYLLQLSEEDTKELYLKILKELEQQDEINRINSNKVQFEKTDIVLYVQNNETIRATVDTESKQIRIDFYENGLNIKYNDINNEEIKTFNIDIKRNEKSTTLDYSDSYNNKIKVQYTLNQDISNNNADVLLNIQNDYIKGLEISLSQDIETSNSSIEGIQKKFDNQPNVNITKFSVNQRNEAINSLMQRIDSLLINENNQISSEILNMWIQTNKNFEYEYQGIKEKQKTEFNNQFLPYGGEDVEKNIIYNLLELSGRNMDKYEEIGEDAYRIHISQGTKNVKLAEEIKNKIEKADKSFKISFGYDLEGKINTVEIRGYKKQQ